MTKNTKIFLGVGCGILFIGLIIVVVGAFFAASYFQQTFGDTERIMTEAREFGKTTDQEGCIAEGVRRSKSNGVLDIVAGINNSAYVDSCLSTCRATPGFCDGVPSLFSAQSNDWAAAECQKRGADPEKTGCVHILKRKHQFCNQPF